MADYHPIDLAVYPEIFRQFANYKTVIQGRSPATIEDYLSDLQLFFRIYKLQNRTPDIPLEEISLDDVDIAFLSKVTRAEVYAVFQYLVNERGNKVCARARKLSALKSFYKYLTVTEGLLKENPVRDIDSPKTPVRLPKYLSLEESVDLLNAIWADKESPTRERDFAMITLFLNCGMRLSELVGIGLTDIDRELHSLRVIGKGNKERIIYLNAACRNALNTYLPVRNQAADRIKQGNKNALFLSTRRNQRISQKTVQYVVHKYLEAAGLGNKHFSTHKLRHTAATLMYQTGEVDIRVLKDILGHEQLNTTQIYTHVSSESMERAINKNPLADMRTDNTDEKKEENE